MKKLIYVLLAATLSFGAFAQEAPADGQKKAPDHERFEAEKVAYITQQLSLTVEEAQAFWPVYNQAVKEQREGFAAIREAKKALRDAIKEGREDKEVKSLLDEYLEVKESQKDPMVAHRAEFVKAIGETKTARLYLSEDSFRNKALREMAGHGSAVGSGKGSASGQRSGSGQRPDRGVREK